MMLSATPKGFNVQSGFEKWKVKFGEAKCVYSRSKYKIAKLRFSHAGHSGRAPPRNIKIKISQAGHVPAPDFPN